MRKSEITLGELYAVKVPGSYRGDPKQTVAARVVRPNGKRYIVVEADTAQGKPIDRTHEVSAQAILQPWESYSMDAAHQAALHEDDQRRWREEYEAEQAALAEHRRPFIDALRGITVPAQSSANFKQDDVDLGEWLHDTFVDSRTSGTTVRFDVFEAIAQVVIDLREQLLNAGGGWEAGPTDTGEVTVMVAETNTPLTALQRLEAAIRPETPAGVSPEAD